MNFCNAAIISTDYDPNYVEEKVFARVGGKAILLNRDNKIHVLQRSEKSSRPHGNDFPGGGFAYGENPVDGVRREIHEETKIVVNAVHILHSFGTKTGNGEYSLLLGFWARTVDGTVTLSWEHESFSWMNMEDAALLDWPDFHRDLLTSFVLAFKQNKL